MEEKVVNKTKKGTSAQSKQSADILNSNISFIQYISVPKYSTENSATKKKMTHKPTLQQFLWTSLYFPQVTKSAWLYSWWRNPDTIQEANHTADNSSSLLEHMARPFPFSWLSIPSCRSLPGKKKSCRPARHIERRVKKLRLLFAFAQISLASLACRHCCACGVLSSPIYWRAGN